MDKTIIQVKLKMKMKKLSLFVLATASLLTTGCDTVDGNLAELDNGLYYNSFHGTGAEEPLIMPKQGDRFDKMNDNPFVKTFLQPVSTFSVDADGASYAILRNYINHGYDAKDVSVRIEELLNYFTFDYQQPTGNDAVAINAEVGDCPWNPEHKLLRLGIKGKELKENEMPRANYVFLIDVSGSMYSDDKLDLLKSGLITLLGYLNPTDRISIVTYSGSVERLLESTPVSELATIKAAISKLNAEGSTAGGEGLKMAYEEALKGFDPKGNNRIILGTDGDFNVGVTSTEALVEMVEGYARKGIYMTCLGFGLGNLNDAMMEQISNKGNGTYHYIDSEDEMMKVFVHERQRFVSVANDVKCQVTFDSTMVKGYRLIGYENRVLKQEDFKDDKKDAGEIGAGQTITALYELEVNKNATALVDNSPFVTFDLRYKKALNDTSIPMKTELKGQLLKTTAAPSENLRFAAGVAALGMVLRNSPYKGSATVSMARKLVDESHSFDPHGYRASFLKLMGKLDD